MLHDPETPATAPGTSTRRSPVATLFVLAFVSASVVHLLELTIASSAPNALLDALPPSWRIAHAVLLLGASIGAALVGTLVATGVGRVSPRGGAISAVVLPALILGFEALRASGDIRGDRLFLLGGGAILFAMVGGVVASRRHFVGRPANSVVVGLVGLSICALIGAFGFGGGMTPKKALASAPVEEGPRAPDVTPSLPPADHLLVLLIDTLRADHLGCYGYERDTSPRIDRFAQEGTLFEHAMTPKPKTSPAVASFFTGLWPQSHGIHTTHTPLPAEHVTLAESLKEAGFSTFGASANVNITEEFHFDQGFDEFVYVQRLKEDGDVVRDKDADRLKDHFLEWLDRRDSEERWFGYLQFVDPHAPYGAPGEFEEMFRGDDLDGRLGIRDDFVVDDSEPIDSIEPHVFDPNVGFDLDGYVARYDGEIRFTDHVIGEILDELDRRGLRDSTTIVVTADHGESMEDHHVYFHHGSFPYEEHVHIPLVVRGPGVGQGTRRSELVSLVGLMPTLQRLVGVVPSEGVEGVPFDRLLIADAAHEAMEPIFLSSRTGKSLTEGLRTDRHKYLERSRGEEPWDLFHWKNLLLPGERYRRTMSEWRNYELATELYDLSTDPEETRNLVYRDPTTTRDCQDALTRLRTRAKASFPQPTGMEEAEMTEEMRRELEQMGYLGR